MKPHVSVCVPIYNGGRYLRATMDCLLRQDANDMEIVALDNASDDDTAEILADYASDPRVRIERNDTVLPLPDNWRRAVELGRGELIKVVCADDVIEPTCVRLQAEILDAHPEVSLVASRRHIISADGAILSSDRGLRALLGRHPGRDVALQAIALGINPIGESAGVMFRRADYDAVGGWDPELLYPMDLDLWIKLLARGDLFGQREALASFRISNDSLTSAFTRRQYAEQGEIMRRIARDPHWNLGRAGAAVARVAAPLSLWTWSLRHRLLPVTRRAARWRDRRDA